MGDYQRDKTGRDHRVGFGADESEDAHKNALAGERKTFTASAVGGGKPAPKTPMPKQADYPNIGAWTAAVRKWREGSGGEDAARAGRAAAVKGKLGAAGAQQ